MVVRNGYHGHTQRGTDISHYKYNNERGQGIKSYIKEVPMPDTYRNIYPKSVKNKIAEILIVMSVEYGIDINAKQRFMLALLLFIWHV